MRKRVISFQLATGDFRIFYGIFACEECHLLFEAFDGGEKFEDHEEDEDEASEDDSVDIALDANESREYIAEIWKESDSGHTTPDDDSDAKFENGLMILAFEVVACSLIQHETCQYEDDDLVELERAEVHSA